MSIGQSLFKAYEAVTAIVLWYVGKKTILIDINISLTTYNTTRILVIILLKRNTFMQLQQLLQAILH